ncbi:SPX domain-containing protein 1-like [Impatiens glandulifera]|uniref:SPX domain-containing protein 1-like n=1 Tax=Impatiens glandulifera TaxID=253017 RepID=UPI001FB13A20|nr:SPX domain-containing protein 1-like [Impatiens glandulifera]
MKFGKNLSTQIEETLPEWKDKFLSYKDLKKQLKLIQPKPIADNRPAKRPRLSTSGAGEEEDDISKEESDFIQLLEDEVEKFNTFFVEKEEEYIIRLKDLQERVAKAKENEIENEEMRRIRKENVDFHGEMVLLENYSALNYTGIVKILKKYDKRTGRILRLPFIQKVLQQPFYTTDVLYKLIKECEAMIDRLFPANEQCPAPAPAEVEEEEGESKQSLYMKSTMSALRALGRIRSGSSTVSVFSLPPLQLGSIVLEQKVAE